MKAIDPAAVRPVKVKSLNGMDEQQVQEQMRINTKEGLLPQWEELPEEDTPELDTETVFYGEDWPRHQTTVPFPVDIFPLVFRSTSASKAFEYCRRVCLREKWNLDYENITVVLNQLEMDLAYC